MGFMIEFKKDNFEFSKLVKSLVSAKRFATKLEVTEFDVLERSMNVWVKTKTFKKINGSWKDVSNINLIG